MSLNAATRFVTWVCEHVRVSVPLPLGHTAQAPTSSQHPYRKQWSPTSAQGVVCEAPTHPPTHPPWKRTMKACVQCQWGGMKVG